MIGKSLAHYEITGAIGRGGMGEVFRARDTKLGREVALKLLPPEFASDRERMARFRREARTLASLNHSNIAAIHDIDEADGQVFLTMELVEGLDLAERLRTGPVPVEEAIGLARQLAEGLREAHEKRIVHRDLKPANVKVTPDGHLKVLDFGLARAWQGDEESEENLQNSPTITAAVTHQGVILGTAAYMSPEQARGRVVDHRADIWAFGVILWEMLCGRQLFEGESVSDTLAAVLRAEPNEDDLPADTPPRIRELLRLCLERDRKRRLQDIGDARLFLEEGVLTLQPAQVSAPSSSPGVWRVAALALAGVTVALAIFALWPTGEALDPVEKPVRRWSFDPAGSAAAPDLWPSISPDGQVIAFVADEGLWVRALDELEPRPIGGTEAASVTFWSADSQWLGFVQGRRIFKVARGGGQITPIGALASGAEGTTGNADAIAWDEEGRLVIGTGNTGLLHIPTAGGNAEVFVPVAEGETDFHEVAAVPGGRGWVFVVHEASGEYARFDHVAPGGERREILALDGTNFFDPSIDPAGYLLFRREGMNRGIWAAPFSVERCEVTGPPFLVVSGGEDPSVSATGTLVYQAGGAEISGEMVWLDREGNTLSVLGPVRTTRPFPFLSADDREITLCVSEESGRDMWRFDAASGLGRRVASTQANEEMALLSPDGEYMYSYSAGGAGFEISRHPTNVPSETEVLAVGIMPVPRPELGGMFFAQLKPGTFDFDVAFLELDGEDAAEPRVLVEADGIQWSPAVSPDGRYLVFSSNEGGQDEVFLTELPDARGRWKVSIEGGQWPVWSGDGREIFYAEGEAIFAVDFDGTDGVRLGIPEPLFTYESTRWSSAWENGFAVDQAGERFLVIRRQTGEDARPPSIVVVENWAEEFRSAQ